MLTPHLSQLITALQALTPMPDDDTLNDLPVEDNPMDILDNILIALKQETQEAYPLEIIPPLLEVFGTGTGNGIFWSILHLIEAYPDSQEIYPLIQHATHSTNPGTREWCCLLLGRRRNQEDESFLVERLQDPLPWLDNMRLKGSSCYHSVFR